MGVYRGLDVVFGQGKILYCIVNGELFPFLKQALFVVIGQSVRDNENLKIWDIGTSDIGCFAQHVFKVVVGVLGIVLHYELHTNSCN